jgi:hypothetical protein
MGKILNGYFRLGLGKDLRVHLVIFEKVEYYWFVFIEEEVKNVLHFRLTCESHEPTHEPIHIEDMVTIREVDLVDIPRFGEMLRVVDQFIFVERLNFGNELILHDCEPYLTLSLISS